MWRAFIKLYVGVFILCGFSKVNYAQQVTSKNLLYYVDSPADQEYLLPFIETSLKDMVFAGNKGQQLYAEVKSLNILLSVYKTEAELFRFYTYLMPSSEKEPEAGAERIRRDSATQHILKQYDQLLKITIRKFDQLLEYQFILFDVAAAPGRMPVLTAHLSSGVFIDPRSPACKDELLFALRQVCVLSNMPPEVHIRSNTVPVNGKKYMALGDTLKLEALVHDNDSPPGRITWHWQQEKNSRNLWSDFLKIAAYESAQMLLPRDTGEYVITVVVNDGINFSAVDTCRVTVTYLPRILGIMQSNITLAKPDIPIFQPFLFGDSVRILFKKKYELFLNEPASPDAEFQLRQVEKNDNTNPAATNSEFQISHNGGHTFLMHSPVSHRAGKLSYELQLKNHGLVSPAVPFQCQYRRASPVYVFLGITGNRFNGYRRTPWRFGELGVGLWLHPYAHFEYSAGFSAFTATDTLYVNPVAIHNFNHRASVLAPLYCKKDGLMICAEASLNSVHFSPGNAVTLSGTGLGIHVRLMHNFYFMGTSMRFCYLFFRKTAQGGTPTGALTYALDVTLQPIRRMPGKK